MSDIIERLRKEAKKDPKRIVFPEVKDERVKEAIDYIEKEKIAITIPLFPSNLNDSKKDEFANLYFERKKNKEFTFEEARELMENPLYYSAMMVKAGYADGFVAGAVYTSSAVIKSALECLDVEEKFGLISSCFIMVVPNCPYGEDGVFVYADCGVIPYPTSEQIATISILSAEFTKEILSFIPRVALLSYSTKGSASGRWVEKIREAVEIAKNKQSGLLIDGELQADAALLPEVAKRKLNESPVAGKANVLIFPNLDAGNICYKLTERLAKARAIGPIILGTKQPCSDLSRGCSVEDIIDCTAVTVVRAQKMNKI